MTITDIPRVATEYSVANLQTQLLETVHRLDSCSPDGDLATNLQHLQTEYEYWLQDGSFLSNGGVHVVSTDAETTAHTIPPELGYAPDSEVVEIHFIPTHFQIFNVVGIDILSKARINSPQEDQKHMTMIQALEGCLDYVTLVESGLLPKPDYIIGFTNPTMAKVAERVGLKSAESTTKKMSHERPIVPNATDGEEEYNQLSFIEARLQAGDLNAEELTDSLMQTLKIAASAWKIKDKDLYKHAIYLANRFMINDPEMHGAVAVWGDYEDFKDGVLEYKRKFGSRILRLAEKDLDTFLSKFSGAHQPS